ncbi:MAG: hypothetical protein ACI8P3_000214 [Saprospiraceae bacterium]|jgi:hypothetical protein
MRYLKYFLICMLSLSLTQLVKANINSDDHGAPSSGEKPSAASHRAACSNATAQIDLEVNNIRARLLVGGDIWWDGSDGLYIVPKPAAGSTTAPVSSLFAGAVWIGGLDPAGNLKLAAQMYGPNGASDFWPGPLTETGTIEKDTCADWDKFFTVSGENIDKHLDAFRELVEQGIFEMDDEDIPNDILGWPGVGNTYFSQIHNFELPDRPGGQGFAPFFDFDDNGIYEPNKGDYPIIEIRGCEETLTPQYGDQMIFWIYNDAGNSHGSSGGDAIQMEVQVEAFGYATNDEINDMTFYRYKMINWANETIDSTYFAMWIDPDLGCYLDDYIGCDTALELMYVYNSDALDGEASCNDCAGVQTYCTDIPILGVDYFRGPLGPKVYINGIDASGGLRNPFLNEQGDTIIELGMSAFTYFNNPSTDPTPTPGTTDPSTGNPIEFYRYLSGSWADGTRFTYGGQGYNPGSTDFIDYAFTEAPDDTGGWSMFEESLPNGDRRTIQASGPFRLVPSAKNELIIGVVWIPNEDYPGPSIRRLVAADEVAQALFNNCFDITDGPDAPDVCFIELDEEIIITLSNEESSNNFREQYSEIDLRAPPGRPIDEISYKFEGYKVFQLTSPNIEKFDNPDEARLIFEVDVKNGIKNVFNWTAINNPIQGGDPIFTPELKVEGVDEGIFTTFSVTEDQFGIESNKLINHKKYYFSVLAYAHNEWEPFDNTPPGTGQKTPYLEGRRNVGPESGIDGYTVIPRPIVDRKLNAEYGEGPVITRVEGIGVGGNFLNVSQEQREAMLSDEFDGTITYTGGNAPIVVKVFNPLDIVNGEFELTFEDETPANLDEARWRLREIGGTYDSLSARTIESLNEQAMAEFGFSVSIGQTDDAGDKSDPSNGAIGFDIEYSDPNSVNWLSAIPSSGPPFNYIGGGSAVSLVDPDRGLTDIASGFFYPYRMLDFGLINPLISPSWMNSTNFSANGQNLLKSLPNVDIVMTSDKSKWSRCVIVETANPFYYGSSGLGIPTDLDTESFEPRAANSVGLDGGEFPNEDASGTGMGWFPGYAVNLETGHRLNIFFGENSTYDCASVPNLCMTDSTGELEKSLTGRDMMWNPTAEMVSPRLNLPGSYPYGFIGGGQHYIYVSDTKYDSCQTIYNLLNGSNVGKLNAVKTIKWAGFPLLTEGTELLSYGDGLIPNDVVIKLRVDNPYAVAIGTGENEGLNKYLFSFEGVKADLVDDAAEIETQLDAINVVPNPYYGYSAYETSQFTNTVKITNLPAKSTVTIFTLDGKFVRQYILNEEREFKDIEYAPVLRDQIIPAIEWDLKNDKGIPVASGTYLVHIAAEGLGERVIKWFGVGRQFDPNGL